MDHRAVILDGITVQHVGEILFDSPTTADIRVACSQSYLRSFEDFAFATLFGETVTLSGRMPPVGDSTPGAQLLQQPALQGFLVAIEMERPAGIADLLNRPDGLQFPVTQGLTAVTRLRDREIDPFRHFYIREVKGYLGDHPSIFEQALPSAAYSFSTATRESHYVENTALQALVQPTFVSAMLAAIRRHTDVVRVSDEALTEFVSRALLTHVANYWAFDYAVEGQPHGSARLPHVTRALIRSKADAVSLDEERERRLRRLVYRGVLPHALLWVLSIARKKDSFLDGLREVRDSERFREIRRYLTELVEQLGMGDRRDADKLLGEIARKSGQSGLQQEPWELSIPIVGGITVGGGLVDQAERRINPGKYYLRQLIRESGYVSEAEYVRKVAQIFPELAGDVRRCPTTSGTGPRSLRFARRG